MSIHDSLRQAAENGDLEGVKRAICGGADAKFLDSRALRFAAKNGHAECVRELIPLSDPETGFFKALQTASMNGHIDCVRLLIPVSVPKADSSSTLRFAAMKGHLECVRELIPVSEPKDNDSLALRWAAIDGHGDCVRLLLPVSDPEVAKTRMKAEGWNYGVALIDSILQEEALVRKHLKPNDERTRIGL